VATQDGEHDSGLAGASVGAVILAFAICAGVFHLIAYKPDDVMFLLTTATIAAALFLLWINVSEKTKQSRRSFGLHLFIYGGIAAAVLIFWNPPPIGDVPLARLTLSALADNVAKWLVLAGLVVGFFSTLND
jgi:hypothetical protein